MDFTHFDPTAADFEMIVPNLCDDMHDCSIADGDAFLARFVPRILSSPAWQSGGVLFITFDEGLGSGTHPDRVATLVISSRVPVDRLPHPLFAAQNCRGGLGPGVSGPLLSGQ